GAIPVVSAFFCIVTLAAELTLPFLLAPRRTRAAAAIGLAIFMVGVEIVADEWLFALLFAGLLLPFLPPAWFRRAPPGAVERTLQRASLLASAAAVLLVALWPAAQYALTRTWDLNPWKLAG